jgi:hypothetical protein
MGQINLFSATLTPAMRDFINAYDDGKLFKVMIVRELDANPRPHAYAIDDNLDYSYILLEQSAPIIQDDIDWIYNGIDTGAWQRGYPIKEGQSEREWERSVTLRYSIERTLNPPGKQNKRFRVGSEEEWERVKEFRRHLEAPIMAFKHYKKNWQPDGHLHVNKTKLSPTSSIILIEYQSKVFLDDDGTVVEY